MDRDFELDTMDTAKRQKVLRSFQRLCFGDTRGQLLFLGALLVYFLTWRKGVFINDTYVIANTLVAVADGHLFIDQVRFGPPTGLSPGMNVVDGKLYGRNYGQVFLALPVLWALQGLFQVVEPAIAISAIFSLLLLGFAIQLGKVLGGENRLRVAGSIIAVMLFGMNILVARETDQYFVPIFALQLATLVTAAFIPVFVYRLLSRVDDRTSAVLAGIVVIVATPVTFWATIPKRHSLTTLLVIVSLYCLYRSREGNDYHRALHFRSLAYATVGLTAWIHAGEGLVLLFALTLIDLPTAPSNRPRDLVFVGGVFLVSLLPFLITNTVISGNPLEPPRLLTRLEDSKTVLGTGSEMNHTSENTGGKISGGTADGSTLTIFFLTLSGIIDVAISVVERTALSMYRGVLALLEPQRVYQTFIRSGTQGEYLTTPKHAARNLSVLESMPLLSVLLLIPLLSYKNHNSTPTSEAEGIPAVRVVDYAVFAYTGLLLLVTMPTLPIHASVTVRYLHPIYPLGVYAIFRFTHLPTLVKENRMAFVWTYTPGVIIGGQLFILAVVLMGLPELSAIQLYAKISLTTGAGVVLVAGYSLWNDRANSTATVAVALATAVTTVFLLVAAFELYQAGLELFLPISNVLAETLQIEWGF